MQNTYTIWLKAQKNDNYNKKDEVQWQKQGLWCQLSTHLNVYDIVCNDRLANVGTNSQVLSTEQNGHTCDMLSRILMMGSFFLRSQTIQLPACDDAKMCWTCRFHATQATSCAGWCYQHTQTNTIYIMITHVKHTQSKGEGKKFILRKASSHRIEELIPFRYPWARQYKLRLHTSLLGRLVLNFSFQNGTLWRSPLLYIYGRRQGPTKHCEAQGTLPPNPSSRQACQAEQTDTKSYWQQWLVQWFLHHC